MGILLSAATSQFISDLIAPDGTTFSAGTTELLTPDGKFTIENIRSSSVLQSKIDSNDIILTSDGDIIKNVSQLGLNYISVYDGIVNRDISVNGSVEATSFVGGTFYGDGSNLTGIQASTLYSLSVKNPVTLNNTSNTYIPMTGAKIENVPSGNYFLSFGGYVNHTSNKASTYMQIYVNGLPVFGSEMKYVNYKNGLTFNYSNFPITVGSNQTVQIKWKTSKPTAEISNIYLSILKIQ